MNPPPACKLTYEKHGNESRNEHRASLRTSGWFGAVAAPLPEMREAQAHAHGKASQVRAARRLAAG